MIEIYGIANCSTMAKARAWLDTAGVAYSFHDYRKGALEPALLAAWVKQLGWEVLLNKRGTTWRKLCEAEKANLDADKAIVLMLAYPAMIKRPVLVHDDHIDVGFSPERYKQLFV
ncbi:MAG: ArsC family reductase [Zetaproteobacteria bacterium CG12_big_fil_rev_8_21_14_0_65_54_13]|nr:MAG: ArsC family reductase [Zetaproteobacteria bacterium CG23_combo_of_CG06-09_8_20_14_all_54_7]PIW50609.1 MAG: ArsC family reductase [Zetaproteobacteria bacterium CG12_big_fil_rev_8_21_14_0_65_54_13]